MAQRLQARPRPWHRVPAVCPVSLAHRVEKNVQFGLKLQGKSKEEAEELAHKYLKMVDLEGFAKAYPKELSGGMKQHVAIARAYAVNPKVLLMDEPFGALDAQTRTQLQQELLNTWEKEQKTCFFITHDVRRPLFWPSGWSSCVPAPAVSREIVDIDIPYPRDQETKMSPRFLELKNHIWSQGSSGVPLCPQVSMDCSGMSRSSQIIKEELS